MPVGFRVSGGGTSLAECQRRFGPALQSPASKLGRDLVIGYPLPDLDRVESDGSIWKAVVWDHVTPSQIIDVLPRPGRAGRDNVCANEFRQD
jgi:hypothetical protein